MKKICRTLLLVLMTFGLFSVASTQSVSASSYHKGTPTTLRGHWRTKMRKVHNADHTYFWGYFYLTIKKNSFSDVGIQSGGYGAKDMSYRYAGNHTYYLKGKVDMGGGTVYPFKWKIKKISARKFRGLDLANKGSKTTTWYKYSGRMSGSTYYPYP
ncbi:hypothetical protein [Secundilactobacillus yichangensis]|uniref:hypothetical protein n=1 Tax=Secundilactobacillus yichangensis TaxID=2799580 RepID=UPI001943CBAF|nr:hypothetical protein [Secundilactobacillus yichangensis]